LAGFATSPEALKNAMNDTIVETLHRMPKTELHLHLEGTISPEALWTMAERNHVALPAGTFAELRALYDFESFDKFLQLWLAMCACLRTPADYEQMVDGFLAECRRQNIRYVEAHFTPYNHERLGLGARRALEVVSRRLEAAGSDPVVRLILDVPSESAPVSGPFTVALMEQEANPFVVAIGLGGPEKGFPRRSVAADFERARAAGYAAVAHAAETEGAVHAREAVEDLKVRRIQHGVRAVEDEATLRLIASRDVCCDVALSSNECLTIYDDLSKHPLRRMIDAGVTVTLSTDDPPFFNTDLNREYDRAHHELGLSVDELWHVNLNGLRYGLAETSVRRRLMREFLDAGRVLGLKERRAP